jgi:hypothetical protein
MNFPFRVCPVCRNFHTSKITKIGKLNPTFTFKKNSLPVFELVQCQNCNTIYQTPLPNDAIFHELYVDTEQFTSDTYVGERNKIVREFFKDCARKLMNKMGKSSGLKVLEIGAGLSWMCGAVKELDTQSHTIAQDVTPECKEICTWVDDYIIGSCEENYGLLKSKGPYDIISLTHVIEHLSYPVDFLIQISQLLSDTGIIFITAPYQPPNWGKAKNNIDIWKKWSYNHVPGHLQYLTPESIKAISTITNLKILSYENGHDGGSAFELMLTK